MARAQIVAISMFLFLGPGICSAGDYWPVLDGLTYEYVNDQGGTLVLSTSYALEGYGEHTTTFEGGCTYQNKYSTDSNGDVLLHSGIYHCPGMLDPYFTWSFNPGVTFIDNPLEVGKTWTPTTTASPQGTVCEPIAGCSSFAKRPGNLLCVNEFQRYERATTECTLAAGSPIIRGLDEQIPLTV